MNTEAALIIGAITAGISAAITQLVGGGLLSSDTGDSIVRIAAALAPLAGALIIRFNVYSKKSAARLAGTTVEALPPPP